MIKLHNVEKFYEQGASKNFVLRRVDIDVRDGEFVSVMGPSGQFIDRVFSRSWNGLWNTIKLKVLFYNIRHAGVVSV